MNILVSGNGVMGNLVVNEVKNSKNNLVGVLDLLGTADFKWFDEIDDKVDVIIDFSHHSSIKFLLEYAKKQKCGILIATTGHDDKELKLIEEYSKYIPIVKATNTSIGINVMNKLVDYASKLLNDFDIEIIEKHHNRKIDAPSGTANTLYEIINKNRKLDAVYDRHKKKEKRKENEIGMHSIRAGNIFGEHTVLFSSGDEIIEIKHEALSRSIFAKGSIKIAEFLYEMKQSKKYGMYEVGDIL